MGGGIFLAETVDHCTELLLLDSYFLPSMSRYLPQRQLALKKSVLAVLA